MTNLQVRTQGLTFLHTQNGQVTVWEGEPLESRLVTTATIDGMVMGADGPVALVTVLDEELLTGWADDWLAGNPQYLPLTPEQMEARDQIKEILTDLMADEDLAAKYDEALRDDETVVKFVLMAAGRITPVAQAHVLGGMSPSRAGQTAMLEAMQACLVAGFVTGKTFNQRGYSL